jgi:APA family basic amino acid/polyamine antiporter
VGAAVASIGALLALLAGVGRTGFAMARNGDLPRWMSAVHERHRVPHRAQAAVGAVVVVLVLATDLRGALGFSSFGVLLYYAVANASAFTQDEAHRRWPRALNLAGVAGCVVLVGALPTGAVLAGTAVVLAGLAGRMLARRR